MGADSSTLLVLLEAATLLLNERTGIGRVLIDVARAPFDIALLGADGTRPACMLVCISLALNGSESSPLAISLQLLSE